VAESSGVTTGLSHGQNVAERGPLVTVGGSLANTRKKKLENNGESGCGWLYRNPKSPQNNPKSEKNQEPTENQNNTKTDV